MSKTNISGTFSFGGLEQKRRPIIILVTGEADNGLRSEDNTVDEQNLA